MTQRKWLIHRVAVAFFLALALCSPSAQGVAQQPSPFLQARALEREGKVQDAFLRCLAIPGAEYAAARIARPKAKEFLPLIADVVEDPARIQDRPRAILVLGDLLLATGDSEGALKCYRQVTGMTAPKPGTGWEQGLVPHDYYPVEPPQPGQSDAEELRFAIGPGGRGDAEAMPFTLGCGSHRDNWLIRRFIALQAWQDAEREFSRIWEVQRQNAGAEQYSGLGLEFTIDYAFFLKRQGHPEEALETLSEPMLRLDMDRNPNARAPGRRPWSGPYGYVAGVSRKEFIRIAYGAFKTAGKEQELVVALQKQIEDGRNATRRVLARVRLHQGNVDAALALELAYTEAGGFDALSAAYRRGLVYEDCRKPAEAAAEYETALGLPYVAPKLPDRDEEDVQRQMMSAAARVAPEPGSPAGRTAFQREVLARLLRLYGALGNADKVLDVTLRQYDADSFLVHNFGSVEQTAKRFRSAGREASFNEWAGAQLGALKDPRAAANLCWIIGDHARAAGAVADLAREENFYPYGLQEWKTRFLQDGKDGLRLLLEALVKANPKDPRPRLELLDLEDRFEGEEAIGALEELLDGDARPAFGSRDEEYRRTEFRNYYDLAYRLMRLYERSGRLDKLRTFGLRIARGERPFGQWWQIEQSRYEYRDANDLPEDVNACLALVIEHADEATLGVLDAVLGPLPDHPAKAQVARRKAGSWKADAGGAIGWANVPAGVSALACNENVLSLACDEGYTYAGMPWGVAVYRHTGEPVTRIALDAAALDLLSQDDHLWVGTPIGLNRITVGSWEVAYLPLDRDLPAGEREPRQKAVQNGVCALALDGPFVWIGTRRDIQRLDTRSNTLRVYPQPELTASAGAGWDRFIVEADCVWADGDAGVRRYDRKGDRWDLVVYGERPVHLIAFADGRLWGHVWLNNELRDRPCLIDRDTLEVTPVLIEETANVSSKSTNGPFAYFGTWQGMPVLGPKYPAYVYDAESQKLRALSDQGEGALPELESDLPLGLRSGEPWRRPDGSVVCYNDLTHKHTLLGKVPFWTGYWTMLRLPGGTTVLAGRRERSPRYQYPTEDRPEAFETWDEEGGLYLISPDKQVRCISSVLTADSLPGDETFSVVFGEHDSRWVCTNHGLAALNAGGGVIAHFTRANGLPANRAVGGVPLGDRVYFATGWGDHGGGLIAYDPQTTVFTALLRSDGLATDKLANLEAADGKLRLIYDLEYMRRSGDGSSRLYPPGIYDPASGKVTPGGNSRLLRQPEASKLRNASQQNRRPMPYLGGFVLSEREHQGKTYICGTRGLVVVPTGQGLPPPAVAELQVKLVAPTTDLLAEASQMDIPRPIPIETLKGLLDHANPYVRARALGAAHGPVTGGQLDYVTLIAKCTADPNVVVRTAAVSLLSQAGHSAAAKPLRGLLDDRSLGIRAMAVLGLVRQGQVPPLAKLEEVLRYAERGSSPDCTAPLRFPGVGKVAEYLTPLNQYLDREYAVPRPGAPCRSGGLHAADEVPAPCQRRRTPSGGTGGVREVPRAAPRRSRHPPRGAAGRAGPMGSGQLRPVRVRACGQAAVALLARSPDKQRPGGPLQCGPCLRGCRRSRLGAAPDPGARP